jgi:hypothetical protein
MILAEKKSLKDQNAWLIRAAMIAHIVAFAFVSMRPLQLIGLDAKGLMARLQSAALPGSASLGLIVIASLILLGLVPASLRDKLVHLRKSDPLPGCRAFTQVGPRASHVDMDALAKKFGPFPSEPSAQNQLFYRIYRDYRDDVGVLDAHRRYLAARDIGTITAILAAPLPLLSFAITHDGVRSVTYLVALLLIYLLCAVSAKNYSWRMVEHVLALASSRKKRSSA